eukprot:COSAG05_NODE_215_length_13904_cov_87.085911_1_plen_144_part_00
MGTVPILISMPHAPLGMSLQKSTSRAPVGEIGAEAKFFRDQCLTSSMRTPTWSSPSSSPRPKTTSKLSCGAAKNPVRVRIGTPIYDSSTSIRLSGTVVQYDRALARILVVARFVTLVQLVSQSARRLQNETHYAQNASFPKLE